MTPGNGATGERAMPDDLTVIPKFHLGVVTTTAMDGTAFVALVLDVPGSVVGPAGFPMAPAEARRLVSELAREASRVEGLRGG